MDLASIERAAADRKEWRVLVNALCGGLCAMEETDPVDLVEDPTSMNHEFYVSKYDPKKMY